MESWRNGPKFKSERNRLFDYINESQPINPIGRLNLFKSLSQSRLDVAVIISGTTRSRRACAAISRRAAASAIQSANCISRYVIIP